MNQTDSMLLERLAAIRTAVRRLLLWYGVCAVASGGVLSFTVIVFLDWWLHLPALLRVTGGVLFFFGFLLAAWHWIATPLRARFSLNAVAGKLERHFRHLGDSLTSAVSFLEAQGGGSETMMRRVIERTGAATVSMPLEQALTLRPLAIRALTLAVGASLAAAIAWLSPGWYATGLARYAEPFGGVEWPRAVQIQAHQGDMKVALGDSLTVRMRVVRGMTPDLRGIVKVRDAGGTVSTFAMQREGQADYYYTLDAIAGDLVYWFEAGDESTERRAYRLTAVKRPVVVEAAVRVDAPEYAQPRAPVELDLGAGSVRAIAGSRLTLTVRSSKPIGVDAEGRATAQVAFGTDEVLPMERAAGDPTRMSCTLALRASGVFQIVLKDADGFENQGRRDYQVVVEPDRPPVVTVMEPAAMTEVTPNGSVTLRARAEDDFGIQSVRLVGELLDGSRSVNVPLYDRPFSAASESATSQPPATETSSASMTEELQHPWDISELKLRAGEVLVYRTEATDIFVGDGVAGQQASSPPLRLKIIGEAEFENRLRDDFALLEKRVRQSVCDQEVLRDEIGPWAAADAAALTPLQIEQARRSGERQFRLARRVAEVAERFARIGERMRLNNAFDQETRAQVGEMTGRLKQTSGSTMAEAARALDGLVSTAGDQRGRQIESAQNSQAAAVDELQEVIRWMGRWGDFQEVVAKTRDLLDRQQEVRAATLRQGLDTVGAAVESLSDAEKAALRANGRDQRQLAAEMEQWLRNAASVGERVAAKDSAAAEAMQQALRLANAQQVIQRMEAAVEAISANRTAGASLDQRAAEVGLTAMLGALEARQARELAELKKTVEKLQDAVAELLRQEEGLLAANDEAVRAAAGEGVFAKLGDEQRAVRRNTQQLGEEAVGSPATVEVGKLLTKAATPMENAETRLSPIDAPEAATHQRQAVALLAEALEELQRLVAETEQRWMHTALAVTRRKLEEIRTQQEEVNVQSAELVEIVRSQGRLDRAGARRASKLAGRQGEIQGGVDVVARDMERTAVYGLVLTRVSQAMQSASEFLTARKLSDTLVDEQRDIVAQLGRLIDALASLEGLPPPDQFADAPGGDATGASGGHQPPVPPVAELMVLKAMQESLRERTIAMHKSWNADDPTEADLRRAKKLGEEQEQLREMTEQVTRQARQGD